MEPFLEKQMQLFRDEAIELLSDLETSLLELEGHPDDVELISKIFRVLHTVKGSGAMSGFDDIARFAHELESVYEQVRNGSIRINSSLINLTLTAGDHIRSLLNPEPDPEGDRTILGQTILSSLRQLLPQSQLTQNPTTPFMDESLENSITYRIRFRPAPHIFETGTNPILLLNELRTFGDCLVIAQTDNIPNLDQYEAEACYTYWDIILTTFVGMNAIRDVFIFVEDIAEIRIDVIDTSDEALHDSDYKHLGQILMEKGDVSCDELTCALSSQKRIGDILVESKAVEKGRIDSALKEQQIIRRTRKKRKEIETSSTIRVASSKLDTLVNLVGELVTVQARLSQEAAEKEDDWLISIAEQVERLIASLRANTMSIRMIPIGTLFNSFRRLVRDISADLGKDVVLITEGESTELDKTLIEKLKDPIVHIIRNCIDHGLEQPEVRRSSGKPEQGMIKLSAEHAGADVLIRISDDGRGLDFETILKKAKEKGIVEPDASLSNRDIIDLVFQPGFSTSSIVSDISGRGVGMDVVKRNIESVQGKVDVRSEKGKGTTVTLKLPLTLAIIDGFMVKCSDGYFVLPLSTITQFKEIYDAELDTARKQGILSLGGNILPYLSLRELIDIDGAYPEKERIVVVESGDDQIALGVDHILGEHQTVIKNLGKIYKNIKGISGATIMGDGTVALILDIHELKHLGEQKKLRFRESSSL